MKRRKSNYHRLIRLLQHRNNPNKISYLKRAYPKDDVYDRWLSIIEKIEREYFIHEFDGDDKSMDAAYMFFPLIDSISYTLFDKRGSYYLERLNYTRQEADLFYKVFRNGHAHNLSNYRLEYDNGTVSWAMFSGSGTGDPIPHFPGFSDPRDPRYDQPADAGMDYFKDLEGQHHIWLYLDKLVQHVKYDLIQRKAADERSEVDLIVGQIVPGKIRSTNKTLPLEGL